MLFEFLEGRYTVDQHVLTRSRQELTLAWAGQSYFNIGGSAVLGRAHIGVLILDESMLKCADLRYVILKKIYNFSDKFSRILSKLRDFEKTEPHLRKKLKTEPKKLRVPEGWAYYTLQKSAQKSLF